MEPTSTDAPATPFDSLDAMKAEHAALLRRAPRGELAPDAWPGVIEFLRRGAATGQLLDDPADRRLAQGLLDYWKATLYAGRRESADQRTGTTPSAAAPAVPTALLADFNEQLVGAWAAAADQALLAMDEPDREAARRVLLRLVRLAPEGREFDSAPARRAVLQAIGDPATIDRAIETLAATKVLRIVPGSAAATDEISLRSAALIRTWERLRDWLAQRLRIRSAAEFWDQTGRKSETVLTGDLLAEAQRFRDLGPLEQDFADASNVENDRLVRDRDAAQAKETEQLRALAAEQAKAADLARTQAALEREWAVKQVKAAEALAAEQAKAAQMWRRGMSVLFALLILLVTASIWAVWTNRNYEKYRRDQTQLELDNEKEQEKKEKQAREQAELGFAQVFANRLVQFGEGGGYEVELRLWAARRAAKALRKYAIDPKNVPEVVALFEKCLSPQQPTATILTQHKGSILALALSRDGSRLVTGGQDKSAEVWDVKEKKLLKTFPLTGDTKSGHNDQILGVAFSPDAKRVATASKDQKAIIWDLDSDRRVVLDDRNKKSVLAVAFSRDGNQVATVSEDGTADLWNADKGELLGFPASADADAQNPTPGVSKDRQYAIAFDPTGARVAVARWDGQTRVWKTSNPCKSELAFPVLTPNPHNLGAAAARFGASSPSVAFSPDSLRLAVGDGRGVLQIWDTTVGKPMYPPTYAGPRPGSGPILFADPAGLVAYPTISTTVQIKVWKEGNITSTIWLPQPGFGTGSTTAVAMTPNASRIATASNLPFFQPGGVTNPLVAVYDISPIEDPVAVGENRSEPISGRPSFEQYRILLAGLAPSYEKPLIDAQKQVLQGEDDQAIKSIQQSLSLPGLDPEAAEEAKRLVAGLIWARGESLAREAKVDEAIATFDRARAIDPSRTLDSRKQATTLAAPSYLFKAQKEAAVAVTVAAGHVTLDKAQFNNAVELLRQAKEWSPALVPLEPAVRAKFLVAQTLANQVVSLARQGRVDDALAACTQAQKFEEKPGSVVTAYILNDLCWWGCLHGQVGKVKFAGDDAVKLDPMNPRFRDTHGLAHALTGDLKGAADDFEAYAEWNAAPPQEAQKRRRWVESLRAGKNPITPDVLKELLADG